MIWVVRVTRHCSSMLGPKPVTPINSIIQIAATKLECNIEEPIRLKSNNNAVYSINSSIILKCANESNRSNNLKSEAMICKKLAEKGLPVPRVIDHFEIDGIYCIAYQKIDGYTIGQIHGDASDKWEACGAFLSDLYAKRNYLRDLENGPIGYNWQELRSRLDENGYLDSGMIMEIDKIRNVYSNTEFVGFCHADYGPSQVMFDKENNLFVIDWERSGTGNILYSAGRFIAMIFEYVADDKEMKSMAFMKGFMRGELAGFESDVNYMHNLSDLCDAHWKFTCGKDHNQHAHDLVEKVRLRMGLTRRCRRSP